MIVGSIGTPCEELIPAEFVMSLFRLQKPDMTSTVIVTGSGVASQRNMIASRFEGDWLLFVDSDMIFAPDALYRLLTHGDRDIVHAVCCTKAPPYPYCTWDLDGNRVKSPLGKDLFESAGCGMAFTLIRRRVFEAMPQPWFEVGKGEDTTALYEDIWFCRKARERGFRIWADPTIPVWHLMPFAVAVGPDGNPEVRPGNSRFLGTEGDQRWFDEKPKEGP